MNGARPGWGGAIRTLELDDLSATIAFGRALARDLRRGDVLALHGTLGAGKTTLARAIIGALAPGEEEVPSPTFTLVQAYATPNLDIVHFDLYRLESPAEVFELGWEDALGRALIMIEWPERLGTLLPPDRLDVTLISAGTENARHAQLAAQGRWRAEAE